MDTITLNNVEQWIVKNMAKARYAYCRKVGALPTRYNEADYLSAEMDSLGAEFAYCRMTDCYPDVSINKFSPWDARLYTGLTVDVKQTDRENGRLLVKEKERRALPDYYALMVGKFPTYRFAGHARAADILRPECLDRSLPHPAYCLPQAVLDKSPYPGKD